MGHKDGQRGEKKPTDGAEKPEHGVVNSAAQVRQILGSAVAAQISIASADQRQNASINAKRGEVMSALGHKQTFS